MPREFVDFGNTWLAHHQGWTMYTWTDAYAAGLDRSDSLGRSPSQSGKANILRYEILLRYGGVYIDTDFECLKNVESLLDGVSCFVAMQSRDVANNAIIGCVAGHAFLRDLVTQIPARVRALRRQLSIKQSGPYFLTERLRGRSDVTVFPAEWFYPYQWHERWRRYERFPGAYAVHHWSLTWRKRRASKPCTAHPSASVVLINTGTDALRLNWVLEGLCEQTASGHFDVVLTDHTREDVVRHLTDSYGDRLRVHYVGLNSPQRGLLGQEVQRCIASCSAPRVILLDSRCVPDPRLVELHTELKERAIVGFSSQRVYPQQKLFPLTPPLDYDALRMHSVPDPTFPVGPATPLSCDWRTVTESCISAPQSAFLRVRIPAGLSVRAGGKWLARQLSLDDYQLVSMPAYARVTRLA